MTAIEAIISRKVQRVFADKPIEVDQLNKIVAVGRHAMSAKNQQPWQFIVIRDRERLRAMGALCATGRFVAEAPAAIVVLKDVTNALGPMSIARRRCRTWPTPVGRWALAPAGSAISMVPG